VIELSSQAFVPQSGFRLVPFAVQIVAQAAGWPAFPLLAFHFAPNRPPKRPPHGKNDARDDPQCELPHHCHIAAGNIAVAQFGREKRKDSSSSAGRNRSNDRRRKRLQKPLFFKLECYFRCDLE
jgi:hypothetical protein